MIARWFIYTAACFALCHLIYHVSLAGPPTLRTVLGIVDYGAFLPLAGAVSVGLLHARSLAIPFTIAVILCVWPLTTETIIRPLIAIGAGLVTGIAIRSIIMPEELTDG